MTKAQNFLLGLKFENSSFHINYFEKYEKFKSREGKVLGLVGWYSPLLTHY